MACYLASTSAKERALCGLVRRPTHTHTRLQAEASTRAQASTRPRAHAPTRPSRTSTHARLRPLSGGARSPSAVAILCAVYECAPVRSGTAKQQPRQEHPTRTGAHAHAHAHALFHGGSPQVASHATTKEESPTIVERFRNNVFAHVTGAQVSNNLDVPRPGLRGPRPGLHEAVCRIICSRRHNLKPCRKRRSGSECASAPRKRDESRMFLFRLAQDGERRQLNIRGQGAVSRSRRPRPDRAAARRHRGLAGKADACCKLTPC